VTTFTVPAAGVAEQWIAASGAMRVPAYDQRETVLGQATVALELDDQAGPLDTVLVPVGGAPAHRRVQARAPVIISGANMTLSQLAG
jgi:hypothetical protein